MSDYELRELLVKYNKETGVSFKFIANAIGLGQDVLSRFKNHGKMLYPQHKALLVNYLMSKTNK